MHHNDKNAEIYLFCIIFFRGKIYLQVCPEWEINETWGSGLMELVIINNMIV